MLSRVALGGRDVYRLSAFVSGIYYPGYIYRRMLGVRTFAEDLAMGVARQNQQLTKVSMLMGRNMTEVADPMSAMDFVADDDPLQFGEYKYRPGYNYSYIKKFCGGTVWIGKNKIDYLKSVGGKARFFWEFPDGTYYADYNEEFHTYPTKFHSRNRSDKSNDGSMVVEVPMDKLFGAMWLE
jgi:hypothetical protein